MNEMILKQLEFTNSARRIRASVLQSATGLSADDVNKTLDALYDEHVINQLE